MSRLQDVTSRLWVAIFQRKFPYSLGVWLCPEEHPDGPFQTILSERNPTKKRCRETEYFGVPTVTRMVDAVISVVIEFGKHMIDRRGGML
jgi:hypothetical protein